MPFANNNGAKIHYEVEGRGPPLLLVHGFGWTWEAWLDFGYVRELGTDYRLIMPDVRGFGRSDKPHDEKAYDYRNIVSDLCAVLDDLNIQRAHYFGYSLGGRIGYRVPIHAPERFTSLVLGGAAYPIAGNEDAEDDILIGHQQDLEKGFNQAPDNPIEVYVAERERRAGPRTPAQRASLLANDPLALLACITASRFARSPNWKDVLPKVKLPCLLFAGEADPRFPMVQECAGRIPGADFFSLPGLNHLQTWARADLAAPHIREFLAKVPAQ